MIYDLPFRHAVIDDFLSEKVMRKVIGEWPQELRHEVGKNVIKRSTHNLPQTARGVAKAIDLKMVEDATGIADLFGDPEFFGAGLHAIPRGGFLNMHVDFNVHPKGWRRRVNLLIFLNFGWKKKWGGDLQLGIDPCKRIEPIAGRCVIFETNDQTWHGHPEPLKCPFGVERRSIALYYYTGAEAVDPHNTIYRKP